VQHTVSFGGKTDTKTGKWSPSWSVLAKAYDCPIPGWKTDNCGNLRLWDALPAADLDLAAFNKGAFAGVQLICNLQTVVGANLNFC
jgi:Carbohydrate phosphorylase